MAFPLKLASHLSGATPNQLRKWRSSGLLIPAVSAERPPLYSFQDLVALRSMVFLRAKTSSQRLTKAWQGLEKLNLVELVDHPSEYTFGSDGKRIFVQAPGEDAVLDLTHSVGNTLVRFTFEELFEEFTDWKNRPVVSLTRPSAHIDVNPRRLGGWPTIEGTRVPYDLISNLVDGDSVTAEEVEEYYPGVTAIKAQDAVAFSDRIEAVAA